MAPEPVSARELDQLHARIRETLTVLRTRLRGQVAHAPRLPDDVARAATDALRGLRASPGMAAGVGIALLAVAGAAAAVLARRRP